MKYYLLSALLLLSFFANAQEKELLKNYQFRINSYKALDLKANLGASRSSYYDTVSVFSAFNVQPNLFILKSTDKLLQTISGNVDLSFSNNKNNGSSIISKSSLLDIASNLQWSNKFYSKSTFFWQAGAGMLSKLNSLNNKQNSQLISKEYRSYFLPYINVGMGIGRIENIADMQNALWLHRALLSEKNLSRKLINEEITTVAKAMTASRNKRLLDYRRYVRNLLKNIDGSLVNTGAITNHDIDYFTNLNDIVFFANNFPRNSGKELSLTGTYVYSNNVSKQTNIIQPNTLLNKEASNQHIPSIRLAYLSYNPISLTKQFDWNAAITFQHQLDNSTIQSFQNNSLQSESYYKSNSSALSLFANATYSIFPNTRTIIKLSYDTYNIIFNLGSSNNFSSANRIMLSGDYFISYNTRLVCNAGVDFQRSSNSQYIWTNDDNNLFLNAGLTISL